MVKHKVSVEKSRSSDIIDLQDHLYELSRKTDLLFLRVQSLDNILFFHVIASFSCSINSKPMVLLQDLPRLQLCQVFDGIEATVLCQSNTDRVQGICKCSERILFKRLDFVSFLSDLSMM